VAALAAAGIVVGAALLRLSAWPAREAVHVETANALEREKVFFDTGAGPYALSSDPAVVLTERVEEILREAEHRLTPSPPGVIARSRVDVEKRK
jgi:hypothetical protein